MFGDRYFAVRFFADRLFGEGGAEAPATSSAEVEEHRFRAPTVPDLRNLPEARAFLQRLVDEIAIAVNPVRSVKDGGTGLIAAEDARLLMGHGTDRLKLVALGTGLALVGDQIDVTGGGGGVTDGDKGDITVSGSGATWTIDNNVVTDAKLRDAAGTSVIGRASGTTGDPADIVASADDTLLRRVAGALGFGGLTLGMAAANLWTFAKLQQIATQRLAGRNTAGTGNLEEVTASQVLDWLGSTRGAVLYRGASGWAILAPGTAGHVLTSGGAGADPSYQAAAGGAWTTVKKTANTTRNSTTVLADDPHLQVALTPGIWVVRGRVWFETANANMDFKYAFEFTGTLDGAMISRRHAGAGAAAGTDSENTLTVSPGPTLPGGTSVPATTSGLGMVEFEIQLNVTASGTFSFQWAQNTSDAGNLTIWAGPYLEYMQVS